MLNKIEVCKDTTPDHFFSRSRTRKNSNQIIICIISKYPLETLRSGYGDFIVEDLHRLHELDSTMITCSPRDALKRFNTEPDFKHFYVLTIEKCFQK